MSFSEKAKLTRRGFLMTGGAFVGGALVAASEKRWGDVHTAEEKIAAYRAGKKGFDNDEAFHDAAKTPTHGAEEYGRAAYVKKIFSDRAHSPVKMPATLADTLKNIAPGIPGQESRYDNTRGSSAGAQFIWQFTSSMFDNLNEINGTQIPFSEARALVTATPLAFDYFDRVIYTTISRKAAAVSARFGLAGTNAAEQFTALCMVNAYNAGPNRIAHLLATFALNYSVSDIREIYDYTPLSLFNCFTEVARRDSLDAGYGTQASEYVFRVLAAAESLNDGRPVLSYQKSFLEKVGDDTADAGRAFVRGVIKPIGAGMVGAVAGRMIDSRFSETRGMKRFNSRRAFILSGLAGLAGIIGHHEYASRIGTQLFGPYTIDFSSSKPEEEVPVHFKDGTVYLPNATREKFSHAGGTAKLFAHAPEMFPFKRLPQKNLTSGGVVGAIQRLEHAHALNKISVSDIQEHASDYEALRYAVKEVGEGWRCRGVGKGAEQSGKNEAAYLHVMPRTGEVLENISHAFQEELETRGLSHDWKIRFIINGLLRSDGKNGTNRVGGASDHSPHMFGVGMDISLSKFDVMYASTNEFFMTGAGEQLSLELKSILAGILKDMHDRKELVLTYEPGTDHFHISAITPNRGDVRSAHISPKKKITHAHTEKKPAPKTSKPMRHAKSPTHHDIKHSHHAADSTQHKHTKKKRH